jgi:hypothetical protein
MAFRGGRKEVIRALIELGAEVPPGMETGLTEPELMVARLKAQQYLANASKAPASLDNLPEFEEIEMVRCFGTDTGLLDAEMMRTAREMTKKDKPG